MQAHWIVELARSQATQGSTRATPAKSIADLGWHVQFALDGDLIVEHADLLRRLPSPLVFDHMGRPTLPAGIEHASFAVMRDLIDKGRTWIKLSGAYNNSKIGPPEYPEAAKIAATLLAAAPERMVWGSDWPHPGEQNNPPLPNDALLLDLLATWAPMRRRADVFWWRIRKTCTDLRNPVEPHGKKASRKAPSLNWTAQ
jgi:predicted TIM-barrel fold metal-dependent hydrolase